MTRTKNQKNIPPVSKPYVPTHVKSQNHSMSDSIKQGFSFGVGSSIANNMINRIFNSKDENKNESKIYELYNKCLEKNDKNIDCSIILQNNIKD
jgi:hypothetical protein